MVAKKQGVKRTVATEHEAAPARKRTNYQTTMLDGIVSTLGAAENLPQATRDMLVSMVQGGLGCPKDERHTYQTMAVDMIGEALGVIRADMERSVVTESEKVAAIEASKSELDVARTQAEELLASKAAASKEKKAQLVQDSVVLSKTKQALSESLEAQRKGDATHVANEQELAAHEVASEQQFGVLKAGTFESDVQAKELLAALSPLVAKMEVEESMVMSLPTACIKKISDRGAFDNMIFEELDKIIVAKVTALRAKVAEGAPGAAERASTVQAAQSVVDAAKAKVQASATQLNVAQTEEKEQDAALKVAEKAVKDFAPSFKKATHARDQLSSELEGFDMWPLASYNELKEHIEKKEEVIVEQQEVEVPAKVIVEESLAQEVVGAVGA